MYERCKKLKTINCRDKIDPSSIHFCCLVQYFPIFWEAWFVTKARPRLVSRIRYLYKYLAEIQCRSQRHGAIGDKIELFNEALAPYLLLKLDFLTKRMQLLHALVRKSGLRRRKASLNRLKSIIIIEVSGRINRCCHLDMSNKARSHLRSEGDRRDYSGNGNDDDYFFFTAVLLSPKVEQFGIVHCIQLNRKT